MRLKYEPASVPQHIAHLTSRRRARRGGEQGVLPYEPIVHVLRHPQRHARPPQPLLEASPPFLVFFSSSCVASRPSLPLRSSRRDGSVLHLPGGNPGANRKSISHRCHPILVAFVWELTKETINLPLGCLQGGSGWLIVLKLTSWVSW